MELMGIDIGGSGIKGAVVDTHAGELVTDRHRIPTPKKATPDKVADVVAELVEHFDWEGPIGCTFPGVVQHGVVHTAANVDDSWIEADAGSVFSKATGHQAIDVVNDADAAGLAEMSHGAGKGRLDTVLLLTLGTGIGSALFTDGILVPNTELGHLEVRGKEAEHRAAESVREDDDLSWHKWAKKLDEVLETYQRLLNPSLIIIGGGVSKKSEKYLPRLERVTCEVIPAELLNEAGIVGAAMAARGGAPKAGTGS
ncbi:MAG: ROK family protein [Acidimicrobiia bacterium]|nr:ROK family protein [Acidimicrobiia bacterium]